jgi:hypothetical protein
MVPRTKSAPNGFRKWSHRQKVPQTDSENAPAGKKCPKRIPKMVPQAKSAPNGFRKCPRGQKVPQTDSENGPTDKKCPKRIPKMPPQAKSAPNGFRKCPRKQKVPQTESVYLRAYLIKPNNNAAALPPLQLVSAALLSSCFFSDLPPLHCSRVVSSRIGLRCIVAALFLLRFAFAALQPECFFSN